VLLSSCTNERLAAEALQEFDYKELEFIGYDWNFCTKKDFYHTGFILEDYTGQTKYGVVCSKLFPGKNRSYIVFPNEDEIYEVV
jgi:hypothetical protein